VSSNGRRKRKREREKREREREREREHACMREHTGFSSFTHKTHFSYRGCPTLMTSTKTNYL
jgi:hypothetical protein